MTVVLSAADYNQISAKDTTGFRMQDWITSEMW